MNRLVAASCLAGLFLLAAAIVAATPTLAGTPAPAVASRPATAPAVANAVTPDQASRVTPVVRAYQKARPAVVNISTEQIVNARMGFGGADLFDDIFPSPFVRQVPVQTLGSGVVIHPAGYIITNAHVVRRAQKIDVIFHDKTKYPARIISSDQQFDLAVLKIEANDKPSVPFLPLGQSDDLMVGETAIAIGNPLGFSNTVSVGVVSATDRNLDFSNNVKISGLIQTDAPINPGNSGGPLLNVNGELIGITTAIRADAQNIGFAIPVDTVAKELADLLDFERLNRVIFGAAVSHRHGPAGPEVLVAFVRPNSPADGKLVKGDRILAVNGNKVSQMPDYCCAMVTEKAGGTVRLTVDRGGMNADVEITLGAKPRPDGKLLAQRLIGMTLKSVTPEIARDMRLPVDHGLVVTDVEAGSPAAQIGVQPRDVLVQIERLHVASLDDLGMLLEDVKGEQLLRIGIVRGNFQAFVTITTRKGEAPKTNPETRKIPAPKAEGSPI